MKFAILGLLFVSTSVFAQSAPNHIIIPPVVTGPVKPNETIAPPAVQQPVPNASGQQPTIVPNGAGQMPGVVHNSIPHGTGIVTPFSRARR